MKPSMASTGHRCDGACPLLEAMDDDLSPSPSCGYHAADAVRIGAHIVPAMWMESAAKVPTV